MSDELKTRIATLELQVFGQVQEGQLKDAEYKIGDQVKYTYNGV